MHIRHMLLAACYFSILVIISLNAQPARKVVAFDIPWHATSSGGSPISGGEFHLDATIGQVGAGSVGGGGYSITGGFLAGIGEPPLFFDGFESGELSAWDDSVNE